VFPFFRLSISHFSSQFLLKLIKIGWQMAALPSPVLFVDFMGAEFPHPSFLSPVFSFSIRPRLFVKVVRDDKYIRHFLSRLISLSEVLIFFQGRFCLLFLLLSRISPKPRNDVITAVFSSISPVAAFSLLLPSPNGHR